MKQFLSVLLALVAALAYGQPADAFVAFRAQKKTAALSTGIVMKYAESGDSNGTPVLLIHGYTDSGRSFRQVMDELAKTETPLRVIAPDLRGHGESSMPDSNFCANNPEWCFTPADFAADIVALMDHLGIAKAHIVGHSLGSVVAQELALQHAGRVNSLVLIGTFVSGKSNAAINQFLIRDLLENTWRPMLEKRPGFRWPAGAWSLVPADLGSEVTDFLRANWVADPVADPGFLDEVQAETIRVPMGVWIGVIRALAGTDYRAALKLLKKPTLILWGTQDNAFPADPDQQQVRATFEAASAATGARVVYKTYGKIPLPASGIQTDDLGHNLHWGAPEAVAADIAAFIRTGFPETGLPRADPRDVRRVLIETSGDNISVWNRKGGSKK